VTPPPPPPPHRAVRRRDGDVLISWRCMCNVAAILTFALLISFALIQSYSPWSWVSFGCGLPAPGQFPRPFIVSSWEWEWAGWCGCFRCGAMAMATALLMLCLWWSYSMPVVRVVLCDCGVFELTPLPPRITKDKIKISDPPKKCYIINFYALYILDIYLEYSCYR
jgi:hypothetical protein